MLKNMPFSFEILLECPSKKFHFYKRFDYVLEFYLIYFYIIACKYVTYRT